jgi:hypothetical protein
MRALLLALLISLAAVAAGLQDQPVGTKTGGDFELGPKKIHLPAGDWTLVARHRWTGTTDAVLQGTNFAGVYLVEVKDGRWTRAVQAYGNVDPNLARGWRHPVDPCKRRDNMLHYRDLSMNVDNQFCFDVSEVKDYMRKATAWRQQAQQWLQEQKVQLPRTATIVRFAKLERAYWTEVFYYFDRAEVSPDQAQQWAEQAMPAVRAGLNTPGP